MEVVLEFIHDNVKLFLTVVVVSMSIMIFTVSSGFANDFSQMLNKRSTEFRESGKTKYDGAEVSGSEVVAAIRRYQNELKITVIQLNSNGSPKMAITFQGYTSILNLPTDWNYINPNAKFVGSLNRSTNGAITEMVFTQKNVTTNAVPGSGVGNASGNNGTDSTVVESNNESIQIISMLNELNTSFAEQRATISSLSGSVQKLTVALQEIKEQQSTESTTNDSTKLNAVMSEMEDIESQLVQVTTILAELRTTISGMQSEKVGTAVIQQSYKVTKSQLRSLAIETDGLIDEVANLTTFMGADVDGVDKLDRKSVV